MYSLVLKPVSSYYLNPIKASYSRLIAEKGIKNKLLNALSLTGDITAPYITAASSLGKTNTSKFMYGLGAGLIPVKDDLIESYNKIKSAIENNNTSSQNDYSLKNNMSNFGVIGGIAGTVLGGSIFGVPGAVIGGVAGDMWTNNRAKKKDRIQDILNKNINNELTDEDLIDIYMDE